VDDFFEYTDKEFLVYFAENWGNISSIPMKQIYQQYWNTCMENILQKTQNTSNNVS